MKPILLLLLVVATAAALAQGVNHRTPLSVSLDLPTKRKFVEKALAIKAGHSFQTVTNTLGKPTTDNNYGNDYHQLDYHLKAWKSAYPSSDSEYVRVRLNQSNQVVSVWFQVELVQPW